MNMPKNVVLWVALAIPVLMVLFVAGSIYLPQRGVEAPKYDFIYTLRNYSDGYEYSVGASGKLVRDKLPDENVAKPIPVGVASAPTRFFRYDVKTNTSRELKFEEVAALKLDNTSTAPDGYELRRGGQSGGVFPFIFSEGNYDDQFLVKGNHSLKLELKKITDPYYSPFQFMGWVLP